MKKNSSKKKIIIIVTITISTFISGGLFLLYGPYSNFRNWLITTSMTTMNHQYLATTFYSQETINKVLMQNKIIEPNTKTDLSLINTNTITTTIYKDKYEKEILEHKNKDSTVYKHIICTIFFHIISPLNLLLLYQVHRV